MKSPLVIAHRGDSSNALENSLESIKRALLLNVDMIEIDVRLSRDRVLYVIHDKTTGRTAGQSIDIEKSLSGEIKKIRLTNNEPIPTLSDVLNLVSGTCGLNLEVKSAGAGSLTASYLHSTNYHGYTLISSFKEDEVLAARKVMPVLPTSVIFDVFMPRDIPQYKARGYSVVSLRKKTVTAELITACHDQKIQVYVWTVDEEEEMQTLISWGVDGIYSNRPGVLKNLLARGNFHG